MDLNATVLARIYDRRFEATVQKGYRSVVNCELTCLTLKCWIINAVRGLNLVNWLDISGKHDITKIDQAADDSVCSPPINFNR